MTVQQWIQRMVKEHGSQSALARFLGVDPSQVANWKRGSWAPRANTLALTGYEWQIVKRQEIAKPEAK